MNKFDKSSSGFSLIELIVATVIISIIVSIGFATYASFHATQRVRQAAFTLKNDLRFAQNNASSGVFTPSPTCASLYGYQIDIETAAKTYNLVRLCNTLPDPEVVATYALPENVKFKSVTVDPVIFLVLDKTVATTGNIDLSNDNGPGTNPFRISVSSTGEISGPEKL
ncbi:hypothetical protein A2Z33_01150 [Candidatus Gottesmanbacteria bacterium RBG_16_52_11]|uniref:General secretion pathway GspH domain-containing protein n=1 Tax=Candidatus Gottesmanbacteria bacterium RBG_16_52_11 TaxID=1798374 RepID=A0A1F5YNQ9_9BACT|nr:MAG: hypothetical protein A2Z33_01150 [Candidatus Gottesmanbacteria bacterium RBG_16_52_11]